MIMKITNNSKILTILALILAAAFIWGFLNCFSGFLSRALFFLLFCSLMCVLRIFTGPRVMDRAVALTVLGFLAVGFCGVLAAITGKDWYIDIGFVWAVESFIVSICLAKFLERKKFDREHGVRE